MRIMKIGIFVALSVLVTTAHAQKNSIEAKPYSSSTAYKGLIFVSGQIGNADAGFTKEVHQALSNVNDKLKQAGSSMKQVLSVTVYLRNIKQLDEFNNVYRSYFQYPFPARTCIAVSDLVQGANVEISVIANK